MKTLLLDTASWDLTLDASGNIAVASDPASLAQDAASAIKLFSGELWYDTVPGVPYFQSIFGKFPVPVSLMRAQFVAAAMTVPGVASAKCFFTEISGRKVSGQVQVMDSSGNVTAASF